MIPRSLPVEIFGAAPPRQFRQSCVHFRTYRATLKPSLVAGGWRPEGPQRPR